jgi:LPS O-antigen subunit length determinant protein (WzzB/FepE family)
LKKNENIKYIEEDEIDLKELIKTLWNKKVFIIIFTSVITILAVIYSLSKTPIYEVKSTIEIGHINNQLLDDTKTIEKKLQLIFNLKDKNNKPTKDKAIVSNISILKGYKNFLEISTQALNNEEAISLNKEVLKFLQNEYKYKLDDHTIKIEQSIKNIKSEINYLQKVEKINLEKDIEKIKKQSIPKIEQEIKFLNTVTIKSLDNKIQFNQKKLSEYETNLQRIIKESFSDDSQSMIMSMRLLNIQNLILDLQNNIENLKKEKEKILNISLKNLELQKDNLLNDVIRKLNIKLKVELVNKLDHLNDQLKEEKKKLSNNYAKNTEIVGKIITNDYPVKPKKKLIVIVGFITGFILSIFLVFFMNFIKSFKEENQNDTPQ